MAKNDQNCPKSPKNSNFFKITKTAKVTKKWPNRPKATKILKMKHEQK